MIKEDQIIAIALACGWKLKWQITGGGELFDVKPKGHCWEVWFDPDGRSLDKNYDPAFPPDYVSDLDAMHEVENTLGPLGLDGAYEYWLRKVCWLPERVAPHGRYFYRANASQRAEAWLRTKKLWVES
jgi:hypothetical protein